MPIQISIIGLGEIGTSLGLALKYQKDDLFRVGSDRHKYSEENAAAKGVVDKVIHPLIDAVADADIVVLALPADQTGEILHLIGRDLKPHAAVLDFSLNRAASLQLAKKTLQDPSHYLGIYPAINAVYFDEAGNEHHTAHEDLFKNGSFVIAPAADTDPSAVKLASDLASLVGAYSFFTEPAELDGMISMIETLPKMLSVALLNTVWAQPGWSEARKMAGKTFAAMTRSNSLPRTPEQLAEEILGNRENSLRMINEYVSQLKNLRDLIQSSDQQSLTALFKEAQSGRENWLTDYQAGKWRQEKAADFKAPSFGDYMGQMFLGGLARRKKDSVD